MAGNTALDVLVAEMLGDIGKLHDQVARLNGELPAMVVQVESMLTAHKASTMAPQKAAQQFLDGYFRQELRSIFDTTRKSKDAAIHTFQSEILAVVNKELLGVRLRTDHLVSAAAERFAIAVGASANAAERSATEALKGICQELSDKASELQLERRKTQWLAMIGASASTGLLVGALTVFILR